MLFFRKPRQYLAYEISGSEKRTFFSGEHFVVGSGNKVNLRIDDPTISERDVEIARTGDRWMIRALGHAPIRLNDYELSGPSTLRSGDVIGLKCGISLRFVDEVAERAAEQSGKLAAGAASKSNEDRKICPAIVGFFAAMMLSSLLLVIGARNRSKDEVVDLSAITVATISAAVADLPQCIEKVARSGSDYSSWVHASDGKFWWLVHNYEHRGDVPDYDKELENLSGKSGSALRRQWDTKREAKRRRLRKHTVMFQASFPILVAPPIALHWRD